MILNPIAIAIPVFLLLITAEWLLSRRRGLEVYRFDDTITDLSCGLTSRVMAMFSHLVALGVYIWVYEHVALFQWDPVVVWIATLFLLDHQYYWWHRASHRVSALWATHVVHHQSEDYNLAVALRQAWFTGFTTLPFYLPLAVLGVPPLVFFTHEALNTLYQFWIHTELVGRIGVLEKVLNTPSHHRVHHGINPKYIDRNHAGVFIVWDRLFGTFQEEEEQPVYGTVEVLGSWSPTRANVQPWVKLWRRSAGQRTWGDALKTWVQPPEWRPEGNLTIPEVDPSTYRKWSTSPGRSAQTYVALGLPAMVVAVVLLLLGPEDAISPEQALLGIYILTMSVTWSALLEERSHAYPLEFARLSLVTIALVLWTPWLLWLALLNWTGSALWLWRSAQLTRDPEPT